MLQEVETAGSPEVEMAGSPEVEMAGSPAHLVVLIGAKASRGSLSCSIIRTDPEHVRGGVWALALAQGCLVVLPHA